MELSNIKNMHSNTGCQNIFNWTISFSEYHLSINSQGSCISFHSHTRWNINIKNNKINLSIDNQSFVFEFLNDKN